MPTTSFNRSRRQLLGGALAGGLGAALAGGLGAALSGFPATAQAANAATAIDLSKVTLRIGTYKGNWRALLTAARVTDTPYRIEWRELNNGVLHIEALNGDALEELARAVTTLPPLLGRTSSAHLAG